MTAEILQPRVDSVSSVPPPDDAPERQWQLALSETQFPLRHCGSCLRDEEHARYGYETHLQTTPSDERTGVTLLLHPLGASREVHIYPADDHHSEHPRTHPDLQDDGGLAVRKSRLQRTNRWLHQIDNHGTFRGPELPTTRAAQFERVVYNAAGLIPEVALAFRGPGDYYLRKLDPEMRQRLWEHKVVRIESQVAIRTFLKKYLFEQDPTVVNESLLDQFLHTDQPIQRWKYAKRILDAVAETATDPIADTFRIAHQKQQLPPQNTWRAARFVVGWLANHEGEKGSLSKDFQNALKVKIGAV